MRPTEALSLEKMRRGRETMRDVPWYERVENDEEKRSPSAELDDA